MVRKDDLRQVDAVAREAQMTKLQRQHFGLWLEAQKERGERGTQNERGDYTYAELRQMANLFLKEDRR